MPKWVIPVCFMFILSVYVVVQAIRLDGHLWVPLEIRGEQPPNAVAWSVFSADGRPYVEMAKGKDGTAEWVTWGALKHGGPTGAIGLVRCGFRCYGNEDDAMQTLWRLNTPGMNYRFQPRFTTIKTRLANFQVRRSTAEPGRYACAFFYNGRHTKRPYFTVYIGWYCAAPGSPLSERALRRTVRGIRRTG